MHYLEDTNVQQIAVLLSVPAKTVEGRLYQARRSLRRMLELGSVSYLALVTAEQSYQQAVVGLAQARTNRYADTAALCQALGGALP